MRRAKYPALFMAAMILPLLLLPFIALAADNPPKVNPAPDNAVTVQYTNPTSGLPLANWISMPARFLVHRLVSVQLMPASVVQMTTPNPCDGQLVTYQKDPKAQLQVTWDPFQTATGGTLPGDMQLRQVMPGTKSTCDTTDKVPQGSGTQSYVITVDPKQIVPPGTYKGVLHVDGQPAVHVTVNVRNSFGVALFITLVGLLAHWLAVRIPNLRQLPSLIAEHRKLLKWMEANEQKVPLLLVYLSHWIYLDRRIKGEATNIDHARIELKMAETLTSSDTNLAWAKQLNNLDPENYVAWGWIHDAIISLKPTDDIVSQLHTAIQAKVPPVLTNLKAPTEIKAEDINTLLSNPPKDLEHNLRDRVRRHRLARLLVADLLFDGVNTVELMVGKGLIFCAAIGATVFATIAVYQSFPTFGAEWADIGAVFAVGFTGKAFNGVVQSFMPSHPSDDPLPDFSAIPAKTGWLARFGDFIQAFRTAVAQTAASKQPKKND